jgi:hypothetical protein
MKPLWRTVMWTILAATLLVALVVGAFAAWLFSEVLPAGTAITIDEDRFVIPAFTHGGHYALAVLGVWLVALVIVMLAPFLIVLGLVVPALLGTLGTVLVVLILAGVIWPVATMIRRLWHAQAKRHTIAP